MVLRLPGPTAAPVKAKPTEVAKTSLVPQIQTRAPLARSVPEAPGEYFPQNARTACFYPPSTMQGAAPFSEHPSPFSLMLSEQHDSWPLPRPLQPTPPHVPHEACWTSRGMNAG